MNILKAATLPVCLGIAGTAQGTSTADELIKQVLGGLEVKDQSALARLTISEAEYRTYSWPKISGYNASAKLEKYYGMHGQGSEAGLGEAINCTVVKVELGAPMSRRQPLLPHLHSRHQGAYGRWKGRDHSLHRCTTGAPRRRQSFYIL